MAARERPLPSCTSRAAPRQRIPGLHPAPNRWIPVTGRGNSRPLTPSRPLAFYAGGGGQEPAQGARRPRQGKPDTRVPTSGGTPTPQARPDWPWRLTAPPCWKRSDGKTVFSAAPLTWAAGVLILPARTPFVVECGCTIEQDQKGPWTVGAPAGSKTPRKTAERRLRAHRDVTSQLQEGHVRTTEPDADDRPASADIIERTAEESTTCEFRTPFR
jgi:hypothetical protein